MTKPRIINILGKKYKLIFIDGILKYGEDEDEPTYATGDTDSTNKVIRISTAVAKEEQYDTLIHEILHAIDDELVLKIPHDTLHRISTSLTDTLLRNNIITFRKLK